MNKIYLQDIATLAFQPIINLMPSPFATLSSQASLHWLNSEFSHIKWGAFMHFYGPTRKLLKIGGLDIEDENFLNVTSSSEKWNFIVSKYLSHDLESSQLNHLIRLLFYLGFYKQGIQLCEKFILDSSELEEKITAKYLKELGMSINDTNNWCPLEFMQEIGSLQKEISGFILFHIHLLFAKFFIRNSEDIDSATKWLNSASCLIDSPTLSNNILDSNLALLRLNKYQADLYFKCGKKQEGESLLISSCKLSDETSRELNKDSPYLYLFQETKRRILDALTLHYFRSEKKYVQALEFAQESIRIDPYCSYALLLAAKIAIRINRDVSNNYYDQASQYGIIERPYAKQALAGQIKKRSLSIQRDLVTEAFDGDIFLIPKEKNADKASGLLKLPIEIRALSQIAESYSESVHWKQIKKTEVYKRFLPFWELEVSHSQNPIFCSGPLVALEVFNNKKTPWFNTIFLQRAMPVNFREELFFAASPHFSFSVLHQTTATNIEIMQNRSEKADHLWATYQTIDTLPKLDRILFCRLLGSLGFYDEALKSLPILDKSVRWDIADEYAFCTKLFLEHIYFAGTDLFSDQDLEFAFEKLSDRPESLRMRLVLTMLGSVYHGKRKNIPHLKKWRGKGFESIIRMQNSQHFEDFEKQLLTSRFYRAVSFYPFLMNDNDTLLNEAKICESYGKSLIPRTEMQKLLYKENLFPMHESMSRIYAHLGDEEAALIHMEAIIKKVDSLDAKAWIQVGEARERNGDFERAFEAFQIAVDLGVPLGGIACYRAGRTCEKMGELAEAKYYYLRSLKFCPKGISPLKRLYSISQKLKDDYLKSWSETNLNNLNRHFKSVA